MVNFWINRIRKTKFHSKNFVVLSLLVEIVHWSGVMRRKTQLVKFVFRFWILIIRAKKEVYFLFKALIIKTNFDAFVLMSDCVISFPGFCFLKLCFHLFFVQFFEFGASKTCPVCSTFLFAVLSLLIEIVYRGGVTRRETQLVKFVFRFEFYWSEKKKKFNFFLKL